MWINSPNISSKIGTQFFSFLVIDIPHKRLECFMNRFSRRQFLIFSREPILEVACYWASTKNLSKKFWKYPLKITTIVCNFLQVSGFKLTTLQKLHSLVDIFMIIFRKISEQLFWRTLNIYRWSHSTH